MNFYNTEISGLTLLGKDVVEITFKLEDGQKMDFTPGQFILVEVSQNPNIMRAYSVLEYNTYTNELKIAVKKVENGQATTIIFNSFRVGMKIRVAGAIGNKLIVDKSDKNIVLVATGIGITPILCMLKDLVKSNYEGNVHFIYGARTLEELYYSKEIIELSKSNKNISFVPVLSRGVVDGMEKGYVTDVIKNIDLADKTIYMCSSNIVAKSFKDTLLELGFNIDKFRCESA